jgi:hypothetical protein
VLLSLGTGTRPPSHEEDAAASRQRVTNKFPFRLYRSFMSMDGESAWRAFWSQLDEEDRRYSFRMNYILPWVPPLDSVESIGYMLDLASRQGLGVQGRRVLSALLAASLFFELSSIPRLEMGNFQCVGSIRCRFDAKVLIRALVGLHGSDMEFLLGDARVGACLSERGICHACGRYCLPIRFSVRSQDDRIELALKMSGKHVRLGAPQTLKWFLRQQGLDLCFGSANHGMPARVECKDCQMSIRHKHALSLSQLERRKVRFVS